MLKKLFDWTPRDVADWEKIRSKGLLRFILGYGLALFGGLLFIALGGAATLIRWHTAQTSSLISELIVIALICLLGGLVNSLVTWVVEEKLYQKYKETQNPESQPE